MKSLSRCIHQHCNRRRKQVANLSIQCRTISTSNATTHKHVHQSILPRIHPQHLYKIINDVDQYQNFLPSCQESKILQRSPCGTMYDAVLRVGLPLPSASLMEERYVSRVRMIPPANNSDNDVETRPMWTVEAKSIQSQLFDSLKSRWQLTATTTADSKIAEKHQQSTPNENDEVSCNVNFEVEIQVSNPLISFTLDKVLKDVAKRQVEAFEKRCREISFDK